MPTVARRAGRRPATMDVGQHAVRAGESIPMQKWNSPQGGQVRSTDATVVVDDDDDDDDDIGAW